MVDDRGTIVGPFTETDVGAILTVVAVVVVLSWFVTDVRGTTRVLTIALAGLVAFLSAVASMYVFRTMEE